MKLWENNERFFEVDSIKRAKQLIAGHDEAMACVDCDPQTYRLFDDAGVLIYERLGYRVP